MKNSLRALPIASIGRHPDVVLAVGVAAIIAMLILPLPSLLMDGLLAANLALAAVILVAVLLSRRPLSISTFPTLLLITTLFRLALNVSTTRMILAHGTAGEVVEAFGQFVIRGDVVVGLVVFLIITLVQFLVIGKGAERVAEVGARFTLDAMPGKQMSIDAALRAGSIDEQEAQRKRDDLGRESQFYGAMDGAMKFVKGDAVAGLIITALNLVAGLIIGVVRNGMTPGTAAEVYCILTVGDGLVSQIPALLITLSAGVLTTRVASKDVSQTLGGNLQEELLSSPKVLAIGASFALALGLVPGLPLLPFMAISGALAFFAWRGYRATQAVAESQEQGQLQLEAHRRQEKLKAQRTDIDDAAPAVVPVGIDCSPELSEALGISADSDSELLMLLKEVRRHLYVQIGVRYPPANVRTHVSNLRGHQYCIRIKDVPVFQGSFDPGKVMAVESPTRLKRMGLEAEPFVHPIQGTQVSLVPVSMQEALNEVGVTTWSAAGVIALQVAHQLGKRATVFLGLHETSDMLERLDRAYPSLVREVVPKIVSTAQLADILRRLVDEGVSVRDLKTILESLAELGTIDMDPVEVTEHVRAGLALQLAHAYAGLGGKLKVVNLDPLFEDMVRAGVTRVRGGTTLVLAPEIREALLTAVHRALRPVVTSGERVVLMAGADVRRYVRMLVRGEHDVAVLSPMELPEDIGLTLLGTVTLPDELPDAA